MTCGWAVVAADGTVDLSTIAATRAGAIVRYLKPLMKKPPTEDWADWLLEQHWVRKRRIGDILAAVDVTARGFDDSRSAGDEHSAGPAHGCANP